MIVIHSSFYTHLSIYIYTQIHIQVHDIHRYAHTNTYMYDVHCTYTYVVRKHIYAHPHTHPHTHTRVYPELNDLAHRY